MSQHLGNIAEDVACDYLIKQGAQLITRNFKSRCGEIDLIMTIANQLIFVEVRYRRHQGFGSPAETVTLTKQRKLIKTAHYYLHQHPYLQSMHSRFDVIALTAPFHKDNIQWIQNAFVC